VAQCFLQKCTRSWPDHAAALQLYWIFAVLEFCAIHASLLFLWLRYVFREFHYDISMYICMVSWIGSSSFYLSPFLMVSSIGLKILYLILYRKYITHIHLLSFLLYPPPPVNALPLRWPGFHSCPSLFGCLLFWLLWQHPYHPLLIFIQEVTRTPCFFPPSLPPCLGSLWTSFSWLTVVPFSHYYLTHQRPEGHSYILLYLNSLCS
jgi:hypothetical protein